MRAVNLVAVFPQPAERGVYRRVKRSLREIAVTCGRRGDPPGLRELCPASDEGTIPPAGQGTATEELAPIDGALLLFELPRERLEARPFGLEVASRDGRARSTIKLDV